MTDAIDDGTVGVVWPHERQAIERALSLARVRCTATGELIGAIPTLWSNPLRWEVVHRITEVELDVKQAAELLQALRALAAAAAVPSSDRAWVDRALVRLAGCLADSEAVDLLLPYLRHRRRSRRRAVYSVLRRAAIGADMGKSLLESFAETGDQEALVLIARNPGAIASIPAGVVVHELQEPYWRMRVLEAVLGASPEADQVFARDYPVEFAWAVGRRGDAPQAEGISRRCEENPTDLELISITLWALGRVGARRELERLAVAVGRRLGLEAAAPSAVRRTRMAMRTPDGLASEAR